MGKQSKRTRAPAPVDPSASHLIPSAAPQLVLPPVPQFLAPPPHLVPPATFSSTHGPAAWIPPRPPQSVPASSTPCWATGLQQPSVANSSVQGACWAQPAKIGGSTSTWYMSENIDDSDLQAWGLDSHPPGGFLGFFKNTSGHTQGVENNTSSQPINVGDDTNGDDCARTEKRLLWTKEEDCRLVSAWLNNSNDPIQSITRRTSNIGRMLLPSTTVPPQKTGKD